MNYIMLNGQRVDLTEEQVKEIRKSFGITDKKLKNVKVGELCKIGPFEFIVLEHSKDTTAVILKDAFLEKSRFGSNNNYNGSDVDKLCNTFAEKLAAIIGEENIVEHTVDLTSDDGLKDYGSVKRKASLLTTTLYRRYVHILDKFKLKIWWWLATAFSTPTHDDAAWVKCVSPRGIIRIINYYGNLGVRPFCILKSDIFVS